MNDKKEARMFVIVPIELKKEIENFRFDSHTETKNEAVLKLIKSGLKNYKK